MTVQTTRMIDGKQAVHVYQPPLIIWHWLNALSIFVLCITGYFIASPLPSLTGEASDHYMMGYIRFAHFASAYIFIVGFVFRIYIYFVGNRHSKEIFLPPVMKKKWWAGVLHEIKWYSFIAKEPRKYVGHNPLAVLAMHVILVWGSVFMIFTGLAMYGEGAGYSSWQYSLFSSWIIPLFGQSQDVHTWHHMGMWYILCFVIVHVYVAFREDIMSRQSLVSTMISGWRMFKDNRPIDDDSK